MTKSIKFLGIAPGCGTFSGFEKSFFKAIQNQGWSYSRLEVELNYLKYFCALKSFSLNKSYWGVKRDRCYHASILAHKKNLGLLKKKLLKLEQNST